MSSADRLLSYGITSPLAEKAEAMRLSVTKIRALSQQDLEDRFGISREEVSELKKCVTRKPIEQDIIDLLLLRSNSLCCVCKGSNGLGVVLHHIEEYEKTQDNSYSNLVVLCASDHDRAHQGGLTLRLRPEQLRKFKNEWEHKVELANAQRAAQKVMVQHEGIDYINIKRIEEMCLQRFENIPPTRVSPIMRKAQILSAGLRFDEEYVWRHKSGGNHLFDYPYSLETEHYRELMTKLSEVVEFGDLSEAVRGSLRGLQSLEGSYAFFIGGVSSKRPDWPLDGSKPLEWRYKKGKVEVIWHADAKYLTSMSAIGRQGGTNSYLLYSFVRTVARERDGIFRVVCSPLMVAQPTRHVNRTPKIAYRKKPESRVEYFDDPNDRRT